MLVAFLPSRLLLMCLSVFAFLCWVYWLLTCVSPGYGTSAALRFQPTKRPQLSAQKPKPKPTLPKAIPTTAGADAPALAMTAPLPPAPAVKSTLADWAGDDDDDVNGFYAGEKRQRGGRKKRKKNREPQQFMQNWDDIYDPSRPNNYDEYKHSDEQIAEVREWKDRLYAHRMARFPSQDSFSDEERLRPMNRVYYTGQIHKMTRLLSCFRTICSPEQLCAAPESQRYPTSTTCWSS